MNYVLRVGIASLALGFATGTANAESFTFTTKIAAPSNSVMITEGMPKPVGAIFGNSESITTYADGRKVANTASCAQWTLRPGSSDFDTNGVCTYTEKNGDVASILFGCILDTKTQQGDCWGGLQGISGSRKDKTGTISWHSVSSADGKSGTATGVGRWND